jgi:hypothetical protein
VPSATEWISLADFFELYRERIHVRVGNSISLGVIELVSAMIGLYEAIVTPPGQPAELGEPKAPEPQN